MTSITVRGDGERFCLGNDPTCTGINPCRSCWEAVRDSVLLPPMRAANCSATDGQILAYGKEYYMAWCRFLLSYMPQRPDLFGEIVQKRQAALAQEWQDAASLGNKYPLTPFGNIVMQSMPPASQGQTPPSPATATVQGGPPETPDMPFGDSPSGGAEKPEWPPGLEDSPPLGRGDAKSLLSQGKRRPRSPKKSSRVPNVPLNGTLETPSNGTNGAHLSTEGLDHGREKEES